MGKMPTLDYLVTPHGLYISPLPSREGGGLYRDPALRPWRQEQGCT